MIFKARTESQEPELKFENVFVLIWLGENTSRALRLLQDIKVLVQ